MGGGGGPAPKPDPKIAESADKQAQLGEEWLAFSKEQFKVSTDRQAQLDALTKEVAERGLSLAEEHSDYVRSATDRQLGLAQQQMGLAKRITDQQLEQAAFQDRIARADRDRYERVYQPIEDQFIEEATTYGTPERQAEAAAEAMADVETAAAASRNAARRNAASMGLNPASGRFQGIERAGELGTALATAGAANTARQGVRDKALALKADVTNLGRGLPAQSAAAAGMGLSASNAALGGSNAAIGLGLNASGNAIANRGNAASMIMGAGSNAVGLGQGNQNLFNSSVGIVGSGYGGAGAGYGNQAATLSGMHNANMNAWQTQQQADAAGWNALGSAIGMGAGLIFSSRELKEGKEPIPDGEALEAVNDLPVERWRYKDGVGDGGEHVGTYAEDFNATTGKGDGQTIPVQDALGLTMKAVQDLDKKVDHIASAVGLGGAGPRRAPRKASVRRPANDMPGLGADHRQAA